jgi:hypothetical protein
MSNPSPTYAPTAGTDNITTQLQMNSYVIGDSIYAKTLRTSNWNAITPKTALPTGMGDQLVSLLYDASIPTTAAGGSTLGLNWTRVGEDPQSATLLNSSTTGQVNIDANESVVGSTDGLSYVKWTKKMLNYQLYISRLQSPWLDINDFRTAAGIEKQSAAIMKALKGATIWSWERRHQTEQENVAGNFVPCLSSGTTILTQVDGDGGGTSNDAFFGENLAGSGLDLRTSGAANADVTPTAHISNAVMDTIYDQLRLLTDPDDAWGNDNGLPVFTAVLATKASLFLKRESGIRDDVRKSSMVDSFIKPLGYNESFRGFYHMTQPDMPRFTISSGVLTRIEPLDSKGQVNSAYATAPYEAAYVIHKETMECQVPTPTVLAPGVNFAPQNYMGDWSFINNKDNVVNILGDKGFYFGTLASATKPKNYEYSFVILYLRTSTTPAVMA